MGKYVLLMLECTKNKNKIRMPFLSIIVDTQTERSDRENFALLFFNFQNISIIYFKVLVIKKKRKMDFKIK